MMSPVTSETGTEQATLTVVGCSGSVAGPGSACSCYLLERGGFRLLLDLGLGAIGPLQGQLPVEQVDAAFITHAHGDHCRDLWGLSYLRQRLGITETFPVYGPADVIDSLTHEYAEAHEVFRFEPRPQRLGPWRVRTAIVEHVLENWAIRLDDRLCYTGDSEPCPALDQLAEGCAVLLAEAAGFDADRPRFHLTAGDAGRLARRSGAGLLVLTHLRPWHDQTALLDEAGAVAGCPVVLAQPGLRIAVPD
jgi:ribonuclease BN (tRNA processing enzyme)